MITLDIGPARADELSFICDSWKEASIATIVEPLNRRLRELLPQRDQWIANQKVFGKLCHFLYSNLNPEVESVLASEPLLLVAREPSDPSFLYGWLAAGHVDDQLAVYFAFTKRSYRELGVMTALVDRLLDLAPEGGLRFVYCARGPRDRFFAERGFEYAELADVLGDRMRRAG